MSMEVNTTKAFELAIQDGIREGVKSQLTRSYNNPLEKIRW